MGDGTQEQCECRWLTCEEFVAVDDEDRPGTAFIFQALNVGEGKGVSE